MINEDDNISSGVDPLVLEIFLFRNNYKDRLLISEINKRARKVRIPGHEKNQFFVNVEDMQEVIYSKFLKDIQDFDSTPNQSLSKSVTSIFFIDSMMREFLSLKYFKVNISDSSVYTRKSDDRIVFDYKVIHSKINLPAICAPDFLSDCARILSTIGLYKKSAFEKSPYIEIGAKSIISKLRNYENSLDPDEFHEEIERVKLFRSIFGNKLENDDSLVLVVIEP